VRRATHSLGGEEDEGSIFWKTQDTALYSTCVSTLCCTPYCRTHYICTHIVLFSFSVLHFYPFGYGMDAIKTVVRARVRALNSCLVWLYRLGPVTVPFTRKDSTYGSAWIRTALSRRDPDSAATKYWLNDFLYFLPPAANSTRSP
jgi:hypothetical protein